MSIKTDFKVYSDQFGLTQAEPNSTSGNGLLYTAQYIAALVAHGELDDAERERLKRVYDSCESQPGLMQRAPIKDDQEGPDDYVGIAYAARFLNYPELAQRIVAYGEQGCDEFDPEYEDERRRTLSKVVYNILSIGGLRKVKNVWNNSHPGKFTLSAWLGRQLGLMASLKFAANKDPSVLEKTVWCVGKLASIFGKKDNHDAWILGWHGVKTAEGKSWSCTMVGKLWLWRFRKVWPGGMGQLLLIYFANPGHPSAEYLYGIS